MAKPGLVSFALKVLAGGIACCVVLSVVASWVSKRHDAQHEEARKEALAQPTRPPSAMEAFTAQVAAETPDRDELREKLVRDLRARSVIGQIDLGSTIARVEVTPSWSAGDLRDKKSIAGALLLYAARKKAGIWIVQFTDIRTGKKLGTFTPELGLELED